MSPPATRLLTAPPRPGGRRCEDSRVADDVYTRDLPWLAPAEPLRFGVDKNQRLDLEWLAEVLESGDADLLIRSHLQPQSAGDKSNWTMFWRALGYANRAEVAALLSGWLADADTELAAAGDPDSPRARVARRFKGDVEQAYNRLRHTEGEPLAWAGVVWSKYPQGPRRVIESLVAAVALHRAGEISDAELHNVLGCLRLDPGPGGQRIDEGNLQVVFDAVANGDTLKFS